MEARPGAPGAQPLNTQPPTAGGGVGSGSGMDSEPLATSGEGEVAIEMQDTAAAAAVAVADKGDKAKGDAVYAVPQEAADELISLCCDVLQSSLQELAIWDPTSSTPEMPQEIIDYISRRESGAAGSSNTLGLPQQEGNKWTEYLDSYQSANQVPDGAIPKSTHRTCG